MRLRKFKFQTLAHDVLHLFLNEKFYRINVNKKGHRTMHYRGLHSQVSLLLMDQVLIKCSKFESRQFVTLNNVIAIKLHHNLLTKILQHFDEMLQVFVLQIFMIKLQYKSYDILQ